jgi:hypothetical protein
VIGGTVSCLLFALFSLFAFAPRAEAQASLPVTSGNVLWLKADAGITQSGGYVSAWADQSGNGKDFTQGTASKQPAYVTGVLNGKPVVRFDDSDDGMASSLNLSAPYTVFIVFNRTVAASASRRAIQGSNVWLIGPYSGKVRL